MAQRKLTVENVEAKIRNHERGRTVRVWDSTIPGLHLRITPKGVASFCVRLKRPTRSTADLSLGRCWRLGEERRQGEIDLGEARAKAKQMIAEATLGHFPKTTAERAEEAREKAREAKQAASNTFAKLADQFMAAPENNRKAARTVEQYRWLLDRHVLPQIGEIMFATLSTRSIREAVRSIQRKASKTHGPMRGVEEDRRGNRIANQCHALVRLILNWAVNEDMLNANPAATSKVFDDRPKQRQMMADEALKTIWLTLDHEKQSGGGKGTAVALQLCYLTLQRPNEVASAHADDFNWRTSTWRIPANKTKTNDPYEVPLSPLAVELWREAFKIGGDGFAFPQKRGEGDHVAPRDLGHRYCALRDRLVRAGADELDGVVLYDGKRLGRSLLSARLGVSREIAERVINHAQPRDMASRYDVADRSADIRRAHESWADELKRIVYGAEPVPNVVRISERRIVLAEA